MDSNYVVLCEIADEVLKDGAIGPHVGARFDYKKKRWEIRDYLHEHAPYIVGCINQCDESRTKKICFKLQEVQLDNGDIGTVVVLAHQITAAKARLIEIKIAETLLPKIFIDFIPTLEFKVMQNEEEKILKSYVTTKLYQLLYNNHQNTNWESEFSDLMLPSRFKSTLRNYQWNSVKWMLSREQNEIKVEANYTTLHAVDNRTTVFKHNYSMSFYKFVPTMPVIILPLGGILADEMGLGKTVELLATVLLNPRSAVDNSYWDDLLSEVQQKEISKCPQMDSKILCICVKNYKPVIQCILCHLWQHKQCVFPNYGKNMESLDEKTYMCPNCWTGQTQTHLVESASTFIVAPNTTKMQWYYEISKHISPGLKVLLYPGVNSGHWIGPLELAKYDIVLTDYNILRSEIYYSTDYKSDRKMRHEARSMRPISPLLIVNWWRVCLDEAQMVENTSQAAEMVHKLPACIRWAITGTPIQRTVDDLAPLLRFIGFDAAVEPYDAWQTVRNAFLLNRNSEPLVEMLKLCMWRTCKSKVEQELGIPPQTEIVHRMEFGNVEALFYREEHVKCTELFMSAVNKHINQNKTARLASISPDLLRIILQPFLRIRQTCSVPVVSNGNVAAREYVNPNELLVLLKSNNEQECKSQLRTWASSLNGIASIHFIRKNYRTALRIYKMVLQINDDHMDEHIYVDSMLQIHALYNILEAHKLQTEHQLLNENEEAEYKALLKDLEWKYIRDKTRVLCAAKKAYELKNVELLEMHNSLSDNILQSISTVIVQIREQSLDNDLWTVLWDEFAQKGVLSDKLQNISSLPTLILLIDKWYNQLTQLKSELENELKSLTCMFISVEAMENGGILSQEMQNFIINVSDCHLADIMEDDEAHSKPKKLKQTECQLCKLRDKINQFECLLFDKKLSRSATVTDGLEKPCFEIFLIKAISIFMRPKTEFTSWQSEFSSIIKIFVCMQSLSKLQIKYWIEIEYLVKAFDELKMCKMRLTLTDNPDEQSTHRVLEYQLEGLVQSQLANIAKARETFTCLSGRLNYLKHLKENVNEPCPICQSKDDGRYGVLMCGHFFCVTCISHIKKFNEASVVKCPICRQDSPHIYFSWRPGRNSLIGEFSKKIECIISTVIDLKAEEIEKDPVKILIFSQWAGILKHIADGLTKNGIKFRNRCKSHDIDEFKDPDANVTCLLMPISLGCKGLNLIEATHVFLVEPILNPGDELQAIGRVHRFGQTKPTTVHRFIVKNTIEENILKLIKSADNEQTLSTHWDLENLTLEGIKCLFELKQE